MMSIPFEQQYEDILQNIEFAIITTYRQRPDEISDWSVESALDTLIRTYTAEITGRTPRTTPLSNAEQALYTSVRAMCEWRLGREQLESAGVPGILSEMQPKTIDEIVACLKRIRSSVKTWHKAGGRRGYLDFVGQYIR